MIQIQWTATTLDEAKNVARSLLERRLVACVNIFPNIHSLYLWQEKIEEDVEVKVLLKTTENLFPQVRDAIIKESSYDIPEISKIEISDCNPDYVAWLQKIVIDSAK